MGYKKIEKCFITRVLPLSMADVTSGFNIATNISSKRELAGLCGLSSGDVRSALKTFCSNGEVEKHFRIMVRHYNGYSFSPYTAAQRAFNTNTCLEYLQGVLTGDPINPSNPSNWETSKTLLQILAKSPIAIKILEKASGGDSATDSDLWRDPIAYSTLPLQFRFSDLNIYVMSPPEYLKVGATKNKEAWLSFMRYAGGLTYAEEEPGKQLRIPNLVQVQRFTMAVLERYQLEKTDINAALRKIGTIGDVSKLLRCYETLMSQQDVGYDDFDKEEESHRDSIFLILFKNPLLQGHVEFKVTKAMKIDFLNVAGANRLQKASTLSGYPNASAVLQIQFGFWDTIENGRRAGKTIDHWIKLPGGPAAQLASYYDGPDVANMRTQGHVSAYLVIIVGSRKILFSRLGANSQLEEFKLAGCS
ncbi:hypothetical protein BC937DRAFT_92562 [Endogone sp. FLAS-F59071]|nr:hypothetical protein BC937DRAFT_92562 [Endogone sp. FLAS-F59071]|eukprot:RUS15345.1 hypothetical protein BC937DRAFT_92562 [Endogone sp. FLAS-F59071]